MAVLASVLGPILKALFGALFSELFKFASAPDEVAEEAQPVLERITDADDDEMSLDLLDRWG